MNRFDNYTNSLVRYSPETFEERAVVPIAMRQRHDAMETAMDSYLDSLNNAKINDQLRDRYANAKIEEYNNNINDLAGKLNSTGAGDHNNYNDLLKLKRAYSKEMSKSGGLGRAIDITKNFDDQQELYMTHAVNTAKKNPEKAKQWWDFQQGNYLRELDDDVFNRPQYANAPEFRANYAPFDVDMVKLAGELNKLVGSKTVQKITESGTKIHYDKATQKTFKVDVNGDTVEATNEPGIKEIHTYIQSQLDPSSDMYQSRKFDLGPGASDEDIKQSILNELTPLINANLTTVNNESRKQSSTMIDGSGNKPPSPGKTKDGKTPASLANLKSDKGENESKYLESGEILKGDRLRFLEAKENTPEGLTEQEVIEKQNIIQTTYLVNQKLKEEDVNKAFDEMVKKESNGKSKEQLEAENETLIEKINVPLLEERTLNALNITRDEYIKIIDDVKGDVKELGDINYVDGFPLLTGFQVFQVMRTIKDDYNDEWGVKGGIATPDVIEAINSYNRNQVILKKSVDAVINTSTLGYNEMFTLSLDEASTDARTAINKGINGIGFNNYAVELANIGGTMTLDGKEYDSNDLQSKQTFKDLGATGVDVKFGSFTDRGKAGISFLTMEYETKGDKSKKGTININITKQALENPESLLSKTIDVLKNNLDGMGQARVEAIKDNVMFSSISSDSEEFMRTGYSTSQDSRLRSVQYTDPQVSAVAKTQTFKDKDYLNRPDTESNLIYTSDGYHALVQRKKGDKSDPGVPLMFGEWLDKREVIDTRNTHTMMNGWEDTATDTAKYKFVVDMLGFLNQVNYGMNDNDALIRIGDINDKEGWATTREEVNQVLQDYKTIYDDAQQANDYTTNVKVYSELYEKMRAMHEKFKNQPIMFKNSGRLIKGY